MKHVFQTTIGAGLFSAENVIYTETMCAKFVVAPDRVGSVTTGATPTDNGLIMTVNRWMKAAHSKILVGPHTVPFVCAE